MGQHENKTKNHEIRSLPYSYSLRHLIPLAPQHLAIHWNSEMAMIPNPTHSLMMLALAAAWLGSPELAFATGTATERAQLAIIVRQLDMLDRQTLQSASMARDKRARYHFDYSRFHADVQRIRAGIHDYLTPQRAQPHGLVELLGDYRQETGLEDAP
jgi:RAQPRD family integrative conjugative element protein